MSKAPSLTKISSRPLHTNICPSDEHVPPTSPIKHLLTSVPYVSLMISKISSTEVKRNEPMSSVNGRSSTLGMLSHLSNYLMGSSNWNVHRTSNIDSEGRKPRSKLTNCHLDTREVCSSLTLAPSIKLLENLISPPTLFSQEE